MVQVRHRKVQPAPLCENNSFASVSFGHDVHSQLATCETGSTLVEQSAVCVGREDVLKLRLPSVLYEAHKPFTGVHVAPPDSSLIVITALPLPQRCSANYEVWIANLVVRCFRMFPFQNSELQHAA